MKQLFLEARPDELEVNTASLPDFYFLRHGLTDPNLNSIMCGGDWDVGLNAAGLSQALTAAQGPLRKCPDLKTICSSPMKRATQTTNILKAVLKLPVIVVEGLREIMVGDWEGQPWHSIPDPFVDLRDPPAGETIIAFERRITQAVCQALKHPGPVLIVSHGGVWYALARRLGIEQKSIKNCILNKVVQNRTLGTWRAELVY